MTNADYIIQGLCSVVLIEICVRFLVELRPVINSYKRIQRLEKELNRLEK